MASVAETMARGWQYHQAGDLFQAEQVYREALRIDPNHVPALYLLGTACQLQGKLDEAVSSYESALRLKPDYAEVYNNLGVAHATQARWAEAVECYRQARWHRSDYVDAYTNMGVALTELGKLDEAVAMLSQAVRMRPDSAMAHYNLGNTLQKHDRFAEAVASYQRALVFHPAYAEAHNNMAKVFLVEGRVHEAIACYRQAVEIQPDFTAAHSNLLFSLNYDPTVKPAQLLHEHRRWAHAQAQMPILGHAPGHDRNPDRRLRIGYVSPDFYNHPAVSFLEPILANHAAGQVETFCYAEVLNPDAVTTRLRTLAHAWRSTRGFTDAQVAEQIRADAVDILVDLAGHASDSRMRVLGFKPAPVQITYLGYPNTTGLTTVDYLLTDAVADPQGEATAYTEEIVRLPGGFCTYAPPRHAPDIAPPPARKSGCLTFGSLQNLAKLNAGVLDLWCRLLRAIPSAHLLIFRNTMTESVKEHLKRQLTMRGIDDQRIALRDTTDAGTHKYLGVYGMVDISLDTLPWSGHTSACESLWMGVPVLTMRGTRHAGRMAASVLTSLGLTDWIADTPEKFIEIGIRQAGDLDALARLRSELRPRMQASGLCDGKTFTSSLEATYRNLWRRWCAKQRA